MSDSQTFEFVDQGNRLNEIRRYFKLSQKQLAQIVEAGQGNFSTVVSGRRKIPKAWYLHLEKKYPQLNIDWLRTGKAEMLKVVGQPSADIVSESAPPDYINVRELSKAEMERMITRLAYEMTEMRSRVEALENWKAQMSPE